MQGRRWFAAAGLFVSLCTAKGQTFNIYAAASLKESIKEISKDFEKRYPNFHVAVTLGGSQQLAAQIRQGAPADVLLSAGMEQLKGLPYDPASLRIFAYNTLAIVVPAQSTEVQSLQDLAKTHLLIVADKAVPVGSYTLQMLSKAERKLGQRWRARVESRIISREHDVRSVLAKVALGEADAGIVYTTDVSTAGQRVRMISIPDDQNIEAAYPAVRFTTSPNADLAKDFMRFLFEKKAQKALVNHGFSSPIIPGGSIQLSDHGKSSLLTARRIRSLPIKNFTANEHGIVRSFRGYDLGFLLKGTEKRFGKTMVEISAGDGYKQVLELQDIVKGGGYLVDSAHDNFQLILPSKPPKFWVHWVREIVIR